MIKPIVHQTQPSENSCVCTCLAMLMGKPAADVVAKWHTKYYMEHETLLEILEEEGFRVHCHYAAGAARLVEGKLYLITVPSLNIEGSFHQVIVDWRDRSKPGVCYDPAKGLEGRKYYTLDMDEWDEVDAARLLTSWIIDFTILGMPQ